MFGVIDVPANYNIMAITAYDTDLKYVSVKDKSQVKISKKCKNGGSKSSSTSSMSMTSMNMKRRRGLQGSRSSASNSESRSFPRGSGSKYSRSLQDQVGGTQETCAAFFDGDDDLVDVDSVNDGVVTAEETSGASENCITEDKLMETFDTYDVDGNGELSCEELSGLVSCDEIKAVFGKESLTKTDVLQFAGSAICE